MKAIKNTYTRYHYALKRFENKAQYIMIYREHGGYQRVLEDHTHRVILMVFDAVLAIPKTKYFHI